MERSGRPSRGASTSFASAIQLMAQTRSPSTRPDGGRAPSRARPAAGWRHRPASAEVRRGSGRTTHLRSGRPVRRRGLSCWAREGPTHGAGVGVTGALRKRLHNCCRYSSIKLSASSSDQSSSTARTATLRPLPVATRASKVCMVTGFQEYEDRGPGVRSVFVHQRVPCPSRWVASRTPRVLCPLCNGRASRRRACGS